MQRRFLILLFGDLGDTLLTVPALRALRRRYPDAHVTLLTKELPARVVEGLGLVDRVLVVDKHDFDNPRALLSPRAWLSLVRLWVALRTTRPDTAVLYHHLVTRWGTIKFALLALASGARIRAGIDNGRGWFLTHRVVDQGFGAKHEAEYYMDVSRLLDAEGPLELDVSVSDDDRAVAGSLLPICGTLVAVHAGTGWYGPGRRWGGQKFADAAIRLANQRDASFVVVGTEADRDEARAVIEAVGPRAVDLVGRTTLGELAAVLSRCDVVLANDGGVAHLAAAVGTPVVTIFGPSNDRAWRPLTGVALTSDLPCRPCFYRGFGRGLPKGCVSRECLARVTPTHAADSVASLLP